MIIIKNSRNLVWTGTGWTIKLHEAKEYPSLTSAQQVIEHNIQRGKWETPYQYIIEIFWSEILQKYVTIPED